MKTEAIEILGITADRVTVVPRGRSRVELGARSGARRSAKRAELGLLSDTYVLLNVGRQDHQKAQAGLIHAFAKVLLDHPKTVLLLAGREGDATPEIQGAIRESGVGASVQMLGLRTDVNDLYVAADLFVFPSHYEGLGCSLLEAMALSTPIIGSDAAAISEVLGAGNLGTVIPRGDTNALAIAISDLLDNPQECADMTDRAAAKFTQEYELDIVADRTREMYSGIVPQRT